MSAPAKTVELIWPIQVLKRRGNHGRAFTAAQNADRITTTIRSLGFAPRVNVRGRVAVFR